MSPTIRIIILLLFLGWGGGGYAQYSLKGRILLADDSVSTANVSLYNHDGTFLLGTSVSSDGTFFLMPISSEDRCFMIASCMSYRSDTLWIDHIDRNIDVGTVYLQPASIELEMVTVTAHNVITKDGVKHIFPSSYHLKNSTDAFMMLGKMYLPRITTDGLTKTIRLNGGGTVRVFINGREASEKEISSLPIEDIKRIEYHDTPEARYGYVDVALDFITRHSNTGVNLYLSAWQGIATSFGEDNVVAKINHGHSQFSVDYYLAYRNWHKLWRENNEIFHFTNETIMRTELGVPAKFKYDNHSLRLNYNYQNEKLLINTAIGTNYNHRPHRDWESEIRRSDRTVATHMIDNSSSHNNAPYARIYAQYSIGERQLLAFSLSGISLNGKYNRLYNEKMITDSIETISTHVKEAQKNWFFSSLYENQLKVGTLSAGVNINGRFAKNGYDNFSNTGFSRSGSNLRFRDLYIFSQFGRQVNKHCYYRIGIGLSRTWMKSDGMEYHYFTLRPSFSVRYLIKENAEVRYFGSVYSTPPILSELSMQVQRIDFLQSRQGNLGLKRQVNYYNALAFSYTHKKNNFGLYLNHTYQTAPIMEVTRIKQNRVVRSYENHRNYQLCNAEASYNGRLFNDIFSFKAYVGLKYFISNGNDYMHRRSIPYFGGKVEINYRHITLTWFAEYNTQDNFRGETLSQSGDDGHMLVLAYHTNRYRFSIDAINLLTSAHIGAKKNYSAVAPYIRYEYLDEVKNLIRINLIFNLSFGKRYKDSRQHIGDSISEESTILKGEK